MLLRRPDRQTDGVDIGLSGLGHRLVEVGRRRCAHHGVVHSGFGHQGRAVRHPVARIIKRLDVGEGLLAEIVPDARFRRHHIGLIAAVEDHPVGPLLRLDVLPVEAPADVHQFDGVQRASAAPGGARSVGRLSVKAIFH